MATRADIIDVRVRINDPEGYRAIVDVADDASLPAAPAPYTAYYVEDTGAYKATEETSGAVASDYEILPLYVSDTRIDAWIDDVGVARAECKALYAVSVAIGAELRLRRSQAGAEDLEWVSLKDAYQYYKDLAAECEKRYESSQSATTGRYGTSSQPEIAGGEV